MKTLNLTRDEVLTILEMFYQEQDESMYNNKPDNDNCIDCDIKMNGYKGAIQMDKNELLKELNYLIEDYANGSVELRDEKYIINIDEEDEYYEKITETLGI